SADVGDDRDRADQNSQPAEGGRDRDGEGSQRYGDDARLAACGLLWRGSRNGLGRAGGLLWCGKRGFQIDLATFPPLNAAVGRGGVEHCDRRRIAARLEQVALCGAALDDLGRLAPVHDASEGTGTIARVQLLDE